jgi:hypothetical protein
VKALAIILWLLAWCAASAAAGAGWAALRGRCSRAMAGSLALTALAAAAVLAWAGTAAW